MTFKEKAMHEHPEMIDESSCGGVKYCPYVYGYEKFDRDLCGKITCIKCWNREMPEERKDDMNKEFTKADLKPGNMCKTRNGEIYMWLNGILYCESEGGGLSVTLEDLTNAANEIWDVVQVRNSNINQYNCISDLFNHFEELPIIWERKEEPVTKDISLEELNAILKEKFPDVDEFNLPIKE